MEVLYGLSRENHALFFNLAWNIWNNRNQTQFEGLKNLALVIVRRVVRLWDELCAWFRQGVKGSLAEETCTTHIYTQVEKTNIFKA